MFKIKVTKDYTSFNDSQVNFYILNDSGSRCVDNMTTSQLIEGDEINAFQMDYGDAQSLLDDLWHLGFRPDGYEQPDSIAQILKRMDDAKSLLESLSIK